MFPLESKALQGFADEAKESTVSGGDTSELIHRWSARYVRYACCWLLLVQVDVVPGAGPN